MTTKSNQIAATGITVADEGLVVVAGALPDAHLGTVASYILIDADGGSHVIDPGWESEQNWELLLAGLAAAGSSVGEVASIVATHLHTDHIGLAGRLREASGAPFLLHTDEKAAIERMRGELASDPEHEAIAHRLQGWGIPADRIDELVEGALINYPPDDVPVDAVLVDGQTLPIPGRDLTVLSTPGHTTGSICLIEPAARRIFTGDHLLPRLHPGLGLGGGTENALRDYLASLDRIAAYADFEVMPGHDQSFHGLAERSSATRAHHLRRSAEVAAALGDKPDHTPWEVAAAVRWSAGWENLKESYLYAALSQTAMHMEYLTAR